MKQKLLLKTMLLLCALIAGSSYGWATTYKLEQVTSVSAGNLYVFEQDGYVMINSVSSSALQTTNSYKTTGLAGTETYVWTLVKDDDYFKMKNVSIGATSAYLTNGSSTSVSFSTGSKWVFNFQTDGTVIIQNQDNSDRFLGYTSSTSHAYKAYATSNLSSSTYPHAIKVYQLVEESAPAGTTAAPTISGTESFLNTTTVTITNAASADGASIYYTLNGDDPTTTTSATCFEYSAPFSIDATTTVKAIAKHADDTNASSVVSKEFTKVTPLTNIAALVAGGAASYVQLDNAIVTYKNSTSAYLEDASGAILLHQCANDLAVGDKISGVMNVTGYTVYNNLPEVTAFSLVDGYTKTSGNTVTPTELTLATLLADYNSYLSRYVKIVGATVTSAFSSKNCTIQQGENTIVLRDQNSSATLTSTLNDVVNVTAHVAIYNSTKQIAVYEQSQIVVKELLDNAITGINDSYELDLEADGGLSVLDLSAATATSSGAVTFAVKSATQETTEYDLSGAELAVSAKGSIVITASVAADADYKAATKDVTINVVDAPILTLVSKTILAGKTYKLTAGVDYNTDGIVTLSSENTNIATVNNGTLTITPIAVGTTNINVSFAKGTVTKAGSGVIALTVTAPSGTTTMPVTIVFEETFDTNDGTGGNDGSWSGSIASNDFKADNTWTTENANGANMCAKFGAGSKKGAATTPALGESGDFTLSFKAAAWNGSSEQTTGALIVSISNGGSFDDKEEKASISFDLKKGVWDNYEVIIYGATASTTITFSAKNSSNNRFFLDEVLVTKDLSSTNVTLSATGYASFCCEYPLDFTTTTGYKAYYVSDVSGSTVTFSQITGKIKGGEPVILYGTPNAECTLTYCASDNTLAGNLLVGTLAPTAITTVSGDYTNFGLSGGSFVKINDGTLPANKAYLPVLTANIPNNAREFTIIFDDMQTTGVNDVRSKMADVRGDFFDLQGRKVTNPTKGLYIVNGKKVIVK